MSKELSPQWVEDLKAGALRAGAERRQDAERRRERVRQGRDLYSNDRQAILRLSWVVYLDALGTKAAVEALDDEGLRAHIKLLDRLNSILHEPEWDGDAQRLVSFSDNVALAIPVTPDPMAGYGLGMFLEVVAAYQLELALRGTFMRGGIAVGNVYADDSLVIGPALVEAVLLEEETCDVPRILLSETCSAVAAHDRDVHSDPEWDEELVVDEDGSIFLNYLAGVQNASDRSSEKAALRRHRDQVTAALDKCKRNPKLRMKYRWVADYHNYYCAWKAPRATTLLIPDVHLGGPRRRARKFVHFSDWVG